MKNKKGFLQNLNGGLLTLLTAVVIFGVMGIVIGYTQDVTTDVSADFSAGSYAANATSDAQAANANIASDLPSIANIVTAVFIIGLLIAGFLGAIAMRR